MKLKPKKILYYVVLFSLTLEACLILGFLSFGGFLALWPTLLPLAFAAFALSVLYDGEIYFQNIKGALQKLSLRRSFLKQHLAKAYLLEHVAENQNAFFTDYATVLKQLASFEHKKLTKVNKQQKKQLQKTLRTMEKWFAMQLFDPSPQEKQSEYEKALQKWLKTNKQSEQQTLLTQRTRIFHGAKLFSLLAAGFMGLGTTYLLMESFTAIPLLASFALTPALIIPLAAIAGLAYGLLTYNAVTDFINKDTLRQWFKKIREGGLTPRNVLMVVISIALALLAIALTLLTMGTWKDIVAHAPSLEMLKKIPTVVMSIINPIITGLSALIFNLQNTSETLTEIHDKLNPVEKHHEHKEKKEPKEKKPSALSKLYSKENLLQIFNPFRLLLTLLLTPLRLLFFIGHLASIAFTTDRIPGAERLAAVLAFISEGFEDWHYFFKHKHAHCHGKPELSDLLKERLGDKHAHNHDTDLPTRLLKLIFSPLYALAALWDSAASQYNSPKTNNKRALSLKEAWKKQTGRSIEARKGRAAPEQPSPHWQKEHAVYRIDRHISKHLTGVIVENTLAADQKNALTKLKMQLKKTNYNIQSIKGTNTQTVYSKLRFFESPQTSTKQFLTTLPEVIGL